MRKIFEELEEQIDLVETCKSKLKDKIFRKEVEDMSMEILKLIDNKTIIFQYFVLTFTKEYYMNQFEDKEESKLLELLEKAMYLAVKRIREGKNE